MLTIEELDSEIAQAKRRLEKMRELIAANSELTELEVRAGFGARKTVDELAQIVADHFQIPITSIRSRVRTADVSLPRQTIYYMATVVCGYKFSYVGKQLGLDHGTIIYGVRAIKNRRDTDPQFAEELLTIIKRCANTQAIPTEAKAA